MAEMRETIHSRLQMIASLLGVPVQDLISGTVPRRLWADNECMRLWRGLRTEAGRDAALDALRSILEAERR